MQGIFTDIINLIQGNLRDRYQSGFPILKELIQNADDARNVSRFIFGDHLGFSSAEHPLLKGAGLFFYNNGDFSITDRRAIASFASNTKAGESESIGKFGLGMKSVFHLCEAFFYIAWDNETTYKEALNPWKISDEDNIHSDWDVIENDDWDLLRNLAMTVSGGEEKGFFLWIPLRKKCHLINNNQITSSIMDLFPGDDGLLSKDLAFLLDSNLKSRISSIIPMLKNLKFIGFRPSIDQYKFSLNLKEIALRELSPQKICYFGEVAGDKNHLHFLGIKQESLANEFAILKQSEKWPKSYYRDSFGHRLPAKDKSKAEGSVTISHQENQLGMLTIQWALFLPLEEESHIYSARIQSSNRHVRIIIHGQFFVDGGRRGIHDFNQLHDIYQQDVSEMDETILRRKWNQLLSHHVSLPLVLETLNEYVQNFSFKDQEISSLTQAITIAYSGGKDHFFNPFKKSICSSYGWYRILDGKNPQWQLVETKNRNLLSLPSPPNSDPLRPWRVFPSLKRFDDSYKFYDGGSPNISINNRQWSEKELNLVIENIDAKVFSEPTLLDYLSEFLEKEAFHCHKTESVQSSLCTLLINGLRNTPLSDLRHNRQKVQNFIRFILPQYRLPLGTHDASAKSSIPESILVSLWKCNCTTIIIPKDLDNVEEQGSADPAKDDVIKWLGSVHNMIEINKISIERCLDVASQLLLRLDDIGRKEILRLSPDLRILQATDPRSLKLVASSFSTLTNAFNRNNLFGFSQGTNLSQRAGYTPLLGNVIPDEHIYLINNETFKLIFSNADTLLSSGSEEAVLISLGTAPKKLGQLSDRLKLLEYTDNPGDNKIASKGLRYLLHGEKSHFDDVSSPLWIAQYQQSPAWEKLWRQVSGVASDSAWNVIESRLIDTLPTVRWEALGLRVIDPADVMAELIKTGTDSIDNKSFNDRECNEILAYVDDKRLWKNLPLHKINDAERCRIEENTFLAVGKKIPGNLAAKINIVERSRNSVVSKKQIEWIVPLDESSIILIALQDDGPGQYAPIIMEMLALSEGNIREAVIEKLSRTEWLPLHSSGYVRPVDVINIHAMSDDVRLLASKADYCYADLTDLNKDILEHKALAYLKSTCLPGGVESLKMLGFLMSEVPGYSIGDIELLDEDLLAKLLPTLVQITRLPAWKIVQNAVTEFGPCYCVEYLLPEISLPLETENLASILNGLSTLSESRNLDAEAVFNMYLLLFSKDEVKAQQLLHTVKLKTCLGNWKLSNEICHGAADVSSDFILDNTQARILELSIKDTSRFHAQQVEPKKQVEFEKIEKAARSEIKEYFLEWKGLIQDELFGAIVSLLGPALRPLADEIMEPHTSDWLYEQIGWRDVDLVITDEFNNRMTIPKGRYKDIWERLRIAIRIVDEKAVTVTNLIGARINVPLSENFTTIIAGSLDRFSGFQFCIPLRKITPGNYSSEELISFIKQTASYVLDKCYYQANADLETLWQELEKSDQLQIDVVRGMILDHLPFYLRQLNANHGSVVLHNALEAYDNARERYQESKSSQKNKTEKLDVLQKNLDKKKNNIADILQEDDDVKRTVLEGLKQKLKDYQYDRQSLPFELFQNSDDAAVELGLFEPNHKAPSAAQKFVIDIDDRTLRFIHWGRKINSNPDHSKRRGFNRDLEKMLVLSSSDKSAIEGVTGKFGLGFKSVFLCCDKPCLLSGRLRVQICGGVLPQPWVPTQSTISKLEHFTEKRQYPGTIVELKLNDDIDVEDLLVRFRQLASIQSVFGRAIRRIMVSSTEGQLRYFWDPSKKINADIEVGECELLVEHEGRTRYGVAFRLKSGTVLFALSAGGFTPIQKSIPSIWVTAPTREAESLGFAVNATFSLDAGRGKLAGDSQSNLVCAEKIGRELGTSIVALFDSLRNDWDEEKKSLCVAKNVSLAEFSASMWKTLAISVAKHEESSICCHIALSAFKKMSQFPIPNGLPQPFEDLVMIENIQYELAGPWLQRNVIENLISTGKISSSTCITAEFMLLLRRIDLGRKICKFGFSTLIQLMETKDCSEENATIIESIADLVWDRLTDEEIRLTSDEFALLRFKNASGAWCDPRDLLCHEIGDKEEKARVSFAPDSARINEIYDLTGKNFFRRCRPAYIANAEILTQWVLLANTDDKKRAALKYLLTGTFGPDICRAIRKRGTSDTWLRGINRQSEYFDAWDDIDRDELLRLLAEHVHFNFLDVSEVAQKQEYHRTIDPKTALNAIYDWWVMHESEQIRVYELEAFPGGRFPTLEHDFLKKEPEARKGWMTLFLLGAFHTIGWNTYEKNKRFVGMCFANGWMDVFISRKENSLDEWMGVIKDFISNKIEDAQYYQWMKEFISIFTIGYWLDDYVDSFLSINRMQTAFSLHHIVAPRANSNFQGGGPDAPPIHKALGMGACFVLRELVRKGFVTNPKSHKLCYVPRKPVRELLGRLGCHGIADERNHEMRSKEIHKFLSAHLGEERATFNNAFDLPLLMIAKNESLQAELFNTTILSELDAEEDDDYVQ